MNTRIPTHLQSGCEPEKQCAGLCTEPVKRREDGRWFITMGHPGFNSPANNRDGYGSWMQAVQAMNRYYAKGRKAQEVRS